VSDDVTAIVLLSIIATTIIVVLVARIFANRQRGESPAAVAALEERMARVEQAVEALAVDSNRLIDGQRHLSQLLTERSGAAQPVARIDRP
jgi:hypothetical protein